MTQSQERCEEARGRRAVAQARRVKASIPPAAS